MQLSQIIFSSYCNESEIHLVAQLTERLLQTRNISQTQIGIVTPYKFQCKRIRNICKQNNWNEIMVGSAEQFQGNERDSIIITTVRSDMEHTGEFLGNPKVQSRAQSL